MRTIQGLLCGLSFLGMLYSSPGQTQTGGFPLLVETFEGGKLPSNITVETRGEFPFPSGIKASPALGSAAVFGFGKSSCAANCWWDNVVALKLHFPRGTNVFQLSFKTIELEGNWGSQGWVYVNQESLPQSADEALFGFNQELNNTTVNSNLYVFTINRQVTNLVILVRDITQTSEILLDDLTVVAQSPWIAQQPKSLTSCLGASARLKVSVRGEEPLSYFWNHNGTLIPDATGPELLLPTLESNSAGDYLVLVSNRWGTALSATAVLQLNDACVDLKMYAGLNISGESGATYVLKYTTNLLPAGETLWVPLATNVMTPSGWFFLDRDSPGSPQRFYGVKKAPW